MAFVLVFNDDDDDDVMMMMMIMRNTQTPRVDTRDYFHGRVAELRLKRLENVDGLSTPAAPAHARATLKMALLLLYPTPKRPVPTHS